MQHVYIVGKDDALKGKELLRGNNYLSSLQKALDMIAYQKLDIVLRELKSSISGTTFDELHRHLRDNVSEFPNQTDLGQELERILNKLKDEKLIFIVPNQTPNLFKISFDGDLLLTNGGYLQRHENYQDRKKLESDLVKSEISTNVSVRRNNITQIISVGISILAILYGLYIQSQAKEIQKQQLREEQKPDTVYTRQLK